MLVHRRMARGLRGLATVAATAPFVGMFGTCLGDRQFVSRLFVALRVLVFRRGQTHAKPGLTFALRLPENPGLVAV